MLITLKTERIYKLSETCITFSNQTLSNSQYKNTPLVQLFPDGGSISKAKRPR